MGRLILPEQMTPSPAWYVTKKHTVSIHDDELDEEYETKIAIRRWIESDIPDTVVLTTLNMSYPYYFVYEGMAKYDRWMSEQRHLYKIFDFEYASSAVQFQLTFNHLVSEISKVHPKHRGEVNVRMHLPGNAFYVNGLGEQFSF